MSEARLQKRFIAAATAGDVATVTSLACPALIHHVDALDRTALHFAAWNGHEDVICALACHRANLDFLMEGGRAPLHLAADTGHTAVLCALVSARASANVVDEERATALHLAARRQDLDCCQVLMELGVPCHTLDSQGFTAAQCLQGASPQVRRLRRMLEHAQHGPWERTRHASFPTSFRARLTAAVVTISLSQAGSVNDLIDLLATFLDSHARLCNFR